MGGETVTSKFGLANQTMMPERAQSYPHPRFPRWQIRACINVWSGSWLWENKSLLGELSLDVHPPNVDQFVLPISAQKTLWDVRRHRYFHSEVFKSIDVQSWSTNAYSPRAQAAAPSVRASERRSTTSTSERR
ncbi:hypothetical protein BYT27DRAFT_7246186 [Phlegmacium glaucopus]|nr:hypothetical protein BYT27DRAFT_7246186 [Phlegmacium glaucopus]